MSLENTHHSLSQQYKQDRHESYEGMDKHALINLVIRLQDSLHYYEKEAKAAKKELSDIHWITNPGQGITGGCYHG